MDKHSQFEEDLVTYLMGELSPEERLSLEEHLRSCKACRSLLKTYRATIDLAGAIPEIEVPADYAERTLCAARAAEAAREESLRRDAAREAEATGQPVQRPAAPAPGRGLTYGIARIIAYASVVMIIFIATSSLIDNDMPPVGPRPPGSEAPADTGTQFAGTGEPPAFRPRIERPIPVGVEDPTELVIEAPPLDVPEEPPLYSLSPLAPTGELHVLRAYSPNPAYRARVELREKKRALRQAADGNTALAIERRLAIVRGLWWLARHQDSDGKWNAANFQAHCPRSHKCTNVRTPVLSNETVTAAALLAMLGDGHTPTSGKPEFRAHVARGIQWLKSRQQADGSIGESRYAGGYFLLSHAIATAALAEAYGMTGEARHNRAAQKAAAYLLRHNVALVDAQSRPIGKNIAVATVRMAALAAAETAHLDLPRDSAQATAIALAQCARGTSQAHASPWGTGAGATITTGMLALLNPAGTLDESLLAGEIPRLRANAPDWGKNGQVYWLCGSIIARRARGRFWRRWSRTLQTTLIEHQSKSGHAIGSWQTNGPAAELGGRVFSTALCILALETPYR